MKAGGNVTFWAEMRVGACVTLELPSFHHHRHATPRNVTPPWLTALNFSSNFHCLHLDTRVKL